jgi:hypothetical protein
VGTSGAAKSSGYLLVGQIDSLKGLENQRVEIRGTFDDAPGAANAASTESMRPLRITSIRPVPGDCGAKQ